MKRNVALLAFCQATMMTANSLLIATSALVGFELAADKSLATLPLALQFLATMLASVPASFFMRRFGRRAGFTLASLVGAAGGALATYAIIDGNFALFCAATLLFGLFNGFAIYYRFAAAEVADDGYRSRAISYVLAGGVVAALAGPNLANWARDAVASAEFAGSYAATIILYLLTLAAIAFLNLPKLAPEEQGGDDRPLGEIAAQPVFLVAIIAGMFGYGIMSLVMTATPLAMKGCGYSFDDTAFVIQWHVFAMFAPSFFTGQLINRFGVLNVLLWGALFTAGCVAVNLFGTAVSHYWAALFMLGIGWNFLFVGATTLLTESYRPVEKAKVQALNDFLVFTTVTVASLSAGALEFHFGWQAVNIGVTPMILLILLATFWVKGRRANAVSAVW